MCQPASASLFANLVIMFEKILKIAVFYFAVMSKKTYLRTDYLNCKHYTHSMDIVKAFEIALKRKKEKNWEKIYVVVDIHDTILKACYEKEETYDYYPYAKEALQLMTSRDDVCMILWSGCYDEQLAAYRSRFAEEGIRFDYANENPEVGKTSFQNFEVKLYFNVGIDDKFGFEAETDWIKVIEALS